MAAVALAIGGGGALSSFETTVLLTVDEPWMLTQGAKLDTAPVREGRAIELARRSTTSSPCTSSRNGTRRRIDAPAERID